MEGQMMEEATPVPLPALYDHNLSKELYRVPPLFSRDGKALVVTARQDITVLSTTTGEVIHRLNEVHTEPVMSLSLGKNPDRLYSASCDGLVCGWDFLEKTGVQWSYHFQREMLGMAASSTDPDVLYVCARKTKLGAKHIDKQGNTIRDGDVWFKFIEYNIKAKAQKSRLLIQGRPIFFQELEDFVVVATPKQLTIWNKKEQAVFSELKFNTDATEDDDTLRVVAVDPTNKSVATVDVQGRVFIWHSLLTTKTQWLAQGVGFDQKGKRGDARRRAKRQMERGTLRTEVTKWHAHGVMCLDFSPEGTHLLSGGEEGVLVVSQVGTTARTFLPRLGAPLCTISHYMDSTACALTTRANKVMLINPVDLRIRWEFRGLAIRSFDPRQPDLVDMTTQIRLWPLSGGPSSGHGGDLVINAREGALQFLDLASEVVVKELEVVQYNRVTRNGEEEAIIPPWVTHCALSPVGPRLATIDVRIGEEEMKKVALKFWDYDETNRRYFLAGCVDNPHDAPVCGLTYNPRSDMVVSSSTDGTFKLWTMALAPSGEPKWSCHASVTYRPDQSPALSFSEDGSVLAASYGALLTLWDPEQVRILGTVQASSRRAPIKEVHFLPYGPYVVTVCKRSLAVWNTLSMTKCWRFKGDIAGVAVVAAHPEGRLYELANGERVDFVVATADEIPQEEESKTDTGETKKDKDKKQPPEEAEQANAGGQGEKQRPPPIQQEHAIHFFSVKSPKPLHTQHVNRFVRDLAVVVGPQASGVAYYSRRDGLRLLSATKKPHSAPQADIMRQEISSRKRPLPTVELALPSGADTSKVRRTAIEQVASAAATTKAIPLSDLLDASTSTLPTPSTLFTSFLQGLLPTGHHPPPAQAQQQQPPPPPASKKQDKSKSPARRTTAEAPQAAAVEHGGETIHDSRIDAASESSAVTLPTCGIKTDLLQLFAASFSKGS